MIDSGATSSLRSAVLYSQTGRIRSAEETVELAWSERETVGITRLADITDLDVLGIPVYNVVRPNAVRLNLTVSSGKGLTPIRSIASGLMEAVERHFGETQSLPSQTMTLASALTDQRPLLDPRRLTPDVRRFPRVDQEFEWVSGHDLDTGAPVLIPAEAVYTPYERDGVRAYESHSDGLVSGNSHDEALLHGLLELIERDACSFGELLGRGSRIQTGSTTAAIDELLARFKRVGIDVHLFHFHSQTGIPVFYALGVDPDATTAMLINAGAGASLDPERAALRAITELAQSRGGVISGSREDFSTRYASRKAVSIQRALDQARAWVSQDWDEEHWGQVPDLSTGDLGCDLALVRERLGAAGLGDVYTVSLAPPGFPFAVLKVIVPGTEFVVESRFRLGPRFYRAAQAAEVAT